MGGQAQSNSQRVLDGIPHNKGDPLVERNRLVRVERACAVSHRRCLGPSFVAQHKSPLARATSKGRPSQRFAVSCRFGMDRARGLGFAGREGIGGLGLECGPGTMSGAGSRAKSGSAGWGNANDEDEGWSGLTSPFASASA